MDQLDSFKNDSDGALLAKAVALLPAGWQGNVELTQMGTHGKTFKVKLANENETLALRMSADDQLIDTTLQLARARLTPSVVNYSHTECAAPAQRAQQCCHGV